MKKILFYSSVKNIESFKTQQFYCIDINLLRKCGNEVIVTNKIKPFLLSKYDASFIYFYRRGLIPALISFLRFKPVYFTGGIDALEKSYASIKDYCIQKVLFHFCYWLSTKCIIVSDADMENVKCIYNNKIPYKIALSYHTIDVESFSCKYSCKEHGLFTTIVWMESKANVIRKGVDKALVVFKYLAEQQEYKNSKFVIIGKLGEGSDYLKECAIKLNIIDKIIFTGPVSEKDKVIWLKKSCYYFQLSLYEGFGLASLEALASKNIVIHTGKGGLKYSIKDFGVLIEGDELSQEILNQIYMSLVSFDVQNLDIAALHVKDNFSNKKRQKDFELIFN